MKKIVAAWNRVRDVLYFWRIWWKLDYRLKTVVEMSAETVDMLEKSELEKTPCFELKVLFDNEDGVGACFLRPYDTETDKPVTRPTLIYPPAIH